MMYQITVNNNTYQVEIKDSEVFVNGKPLPISMEKGDTDDSYILLTDKSVNEGTLSEKESEKAFRLNIDKKKFNIGIKDDDDLLLEKLGLDDLMTAGAEDVKAPMPGKVLEVSVQPKDEVSKGDTLIVLEAMKMENVIKADGDGVIKSVEVKADQAVEKNAVLITFE